MRVSDAERERVAQFLREQALEGRLDHDELDERLGSAYRAKLAGELEDLIEDLPHRRVPARPAPRRPAQRGQRPPIALVLGLGLLALLVVPTIAAGGLAVAVALVMAIFVAVFVLGFAFGPFILIGLLISQAVRRRRTPPRRWTPHY
jgi:Flp pilus assembly protein TadB